MAQRNQVLESARQLILSGKFLQAANLCRDVLATLPHDFEARFFLGVAVAANGNPASGADHLQKVLMQRPDHIDARKELARMLKEIDRRDDAEKEYQTVIRLAPRDPMALLEYGRHLMEEARHDEAQALFEKALVLAPDMSLAHNLLGVTLIERGAPNDAIDRFKLAVAAEPSNFGLHTNLGIALAAEGRFDEALVSSEAAIALQPNDIRLHINHAMNFLKAGRLPEGFAEYEWRHKKPGRQKLPPELMLPVQTSPEGLTDKTVVIYHEEGFGDTLMYLRYVKLLTDAGATVIAWMPRELVRLVEGQDGIAQVLTGNIERLPPFDYHCPIISLPYVFGTTLDTIPADIPYIKADPALITEWAALLPDSTGPRVGLVWAGDPRPYDYDSQTMDWRRSLQFITLEPVTSVKGATFVSLQMGVAAEQCVGIDNPMGGVKDFADTAAIVANLDLVITVDTAAVHLAGAMGKPVFMIDRYDNCWRWFHNRTDSPWYPNLRIFRRNRGEGWTPLVERVALELEAFIVGHG
jgi:Flp pilus assembly protein TadD